MPSVSYSAVGCDPCLEPDGIDGLEYAAGARWAPPRRRRFRGRSIRERKRSEARPAAQPNHQPEECVQHPLPSAPAPARAPSVCDCGVHDCLLQFNNRDPCGSRYTSAQITIAIGDEVRDQNRSLDLMGGGFGDTDNLINSTLGKMQGMYKSHGSMSIVYLSVFAVAVFLVVSSAASCISLCRIGVHHTCHAPGVWKINAPSVA